jgi:hypothetical protein
VQSWLKAKTKPAAPSQVLETARDLLRPKAELVAENALLRQQLIVLKRGVKQPKLTHHDRWLMVLLARKLPNWKQALQVIQPATLLRWHRDLFKWVWRRKSRHTGGKAPLSDETIALIRQLATGTMFPHGFGETCVLRTPITYWSCYWNTAFQLISNRPSPKPAHLRFPPGKMTFASGPVSSIQPTPCPASAGTKTDSPLIR